MTETNYVRRSNETQPKRAVNVPLVVWGVVLILIVVHVGLWLLGPVWQTWATAVFAFIPERLGGGRVIPRIAGSEIWTFVTYAFLHADKVHLISNCVWLLVFSTPVARRLGTAKYLLLMAVTAAAGALTMLATHWGQFLIIIGASASVSGAMAAAQPIRFAPGFGPQLQTQEQYRSLKVLTPKEFLMSPQAVVSTMLFLGLMVMSGASQMLTGTAYLEERQIAWEAHLGGFIVGFLAFYLLDAKRRS